jgi:type II restriction enzyme
MSLSEQELHDLVQALRGLTPMQVAWVRSAIQAFGVPRQFERAADSDLVTPEVLAALGDRLMAHHAGSRQALSKDRFEFAFEAALNAAGMPARLVTSRTNRGHDLDIRGVPFSLKTEASAAIQDDWIHVSKWMELGRGAWDLVLLRELFLEHLQSYERILTLRRLKEVDAMHRYELVEIPKTLLLESAHCTLEVVSTSRQVPQPGHGHVLDAQGQHQYTLYFDGGTERKLQLRRLRKSLCKVHATWHFGAMSTPA